MRLGGDTPTSQNCKKAVEKHNISEFKRIFDVLVNNAGKQIICQDFVKID